MQKEFKKIGLTGDFKKIETTKTIQKITSLLNKNHIQHLEFQVDENLSSPTEVNSTNVELIIVIGGDGFFLNAAKFACEHNIPLLGVNLGRLGFLTDLCSERLLDLLEPILLGKNYHEEKRTLLSLTLNASKLTALNDIVISAENRQKMMDYSINLDGQYVCSQRGDGIIISTPTGSTAYALSAGGPIICPNIQANLILPMFPHSLSFRPLLIEPSCKIEIFCETPLNIDLFVTMDGHKNLRFQSPSLFEITSHDKKVRLIHPIKYNFFSTLRKKLGWASSFKEIRR